MLSLSLTSLWEVARRLLIDILVLNMLSLASFPNKDPVVDLTNKGDLGWEVIYFL